MQNTRRISVLLFGLVISTLALAVPFPGPDGFGYTGTLIPLNLRDVTATGVNVGLDDADDDVATVPIGFTFYYYGTPYTQVEVSSNGFMTFSPTGASRCCSGETIPTAGDPENYIAGWWEDLDPGEGLPTEGLIRAQTTGSPGSRQFVMGFYDVRDNDDPSNVINTFEMILHESTNDIELQILTIQFDDVDSKVTGIENSTGTDGIEVVFLLSSDPGFSNGDAVISNQGYCFSTSTNNCIALENVAIPVPALSLWGIITLLGVMTIGAFVQLRRRVRL